ncbi:hypothetical protein AAVH_41718, partial [Aphelenchoides avenae]
MVLKLNHLAVVLSVLFCVTHAQAGTESDASDVEWYFRYRNVVEPGERFWAPVVTEPPKDWLNFTYGTAAELHRSPDSIYSVPGTHFYEPKE